jgi:hypothetical protein
MIDCYSCGGILYNYDNGADFMFKCDPCKMFYSIPKSDEDNLYHLPNTMSKEFPVKNGGIIDWDFLEDDGNIKNEVVYVIFTDFSDTTVKQIILPNNIPFTITLEQIRRLIPFT